MLPRLALAFAFALVTFGSAWAQNTLLPAVQNTRSQIEAQLNNDGVPAPVDITTVSQDQYVTAVNELVNAATSPDAIVALMANATTLRPGAAEALVQAAIKTAYDNGASNETIARMLNAVGGSLQALNLTEPSMDTLLAAAEQAVPELTGQLQTALAQIQGGDTNNSLSKRVVLVISEFNNGSPS